VRAPLPAPVVDRDLVSEEGTELVREATVAGPPAVDDDAAFTLEVDDEPLELETEAVPVEAESIEAGAPVDAGDPLADGRFARDLLAVLEYAFPDGAPAATRAPADTPVAGTRIVISPLFRGFAVDELVAVIQGLKLLTFKRGDVILREGQPGESLYTITSGKVRVFPHLPRRDAGLDVLRER